MVPGCPSLAGAALGVMPAQVTGGYDADYVHILRDRLLVSTGVGGFGMELEPDDESTATAPRDWLRRRNLRP